MIVGIVNNMKKLLGIIVVGLLFLITPISIKNTNAGWFGFGGPSMSGCVYDEFGRKVDCVNIKFMGKTGLTYNDAERICLNAVRNMASDRGFTHDAATGGCV